MSDDQNKIEEELEQENEKQDLDVEKLKLEAEEYKLGWQRALADYSNLQKEMMKWREDWVKVSELQILEEFIPVYENFKKAFAHREQMSNEKCWKQWSEGIGHIMRQFGDVLKSHNIEEIKTAGEKFDPKFHEAIGEEESEKYVSGMILKEISGGYRMGDKVVRPAKVIISK